MNKKELKRIYKEIINELEDFETFEEFLNKLESIYKNKIEENNIPGLSYLLNATKFHLKDVCEGIDNDYWIENLEIIFSDLLNLEEEIDYKTAQLEASIAWLNEWAEKYEDNEEISDYIKKQMDLAISFVESIKNTTLYVIKTYEKVKNND